MSTCELILTDGREKYMFYASSGNWNSVLWIYWHRFRDMKVGFEPWEVGFEFWKVDFEIWKVEFKGKHEASKSEVIDSHWRNFFLCSRFACNFLVYNCLDSQYEYTIFISATFIFIFYQVETPPNQRSK